MLNKISKEELARTKAEYAYLEPMNLKLLMEAGTKIDGDEIQELRCRDWRMYAVKNYLQVGHDCMHISDWRHHVDGICDDKGHNPLMRQVIKQYLGMIPDYNPESRLREMQARNQKHETRMTSILAGVILVALVIVLIATFSMMQ